MEETLSTPMPTEAGTRRAAGPKTGWALSLSGGGYRAMLFHLGVLWRLNEAGWLPRLTRISSVSGGSITAAALGLAWKRLAFDPGTKVSPAFDELVVQPVRRMAGQHVDLPSVLMGVANPFSTIGERVRDAYDDTLFHGATLRDLPERPVFIINATNLASGALVRFTKRYIADWRVGRVNRPDMSLAVAVACSSAFPPFLSPYHLDLSDATWTTDRGNDLTGGKYRSVLPLSDGGVYDNLGIEPVWKQSRGLIVSDAGGQLEPDSDPPDDWARQTLRVLHVVDHQVRSLRKRQVIQSLATHQRDGVYLGIRSQVAHYRLRDPMPADPAVTDKLARISTRLDRIGKSDQERLVNWGYVMCDTGLRRHVDRKVPRGSLPYPKAPLLR